MDISIGPSIVRGDVEGDTHKALSKIVDALAEIMLEDSDYHSETTGFRITIEVV